jgi:hypothetical protein
MYLEYFWSTGITVLFDWLIEYLFTVLRPAQEFFACVVWRQLLYARAPLSLFWWCKCKATIHLFTETDAHVRVPYRTAPYNKRDL